MNEIWLTVAPQLPFVVVLCVLIVWAGNTIKKHIDTLMATHKEERLRMVESKQEDHKRSVDTITAIQQQTLQQAEKSNEVIQENTRVVGGVVQLISRVESKLDGKP